MRRRVALSQWVGLLLLWGSQPSKPTPRFTRIVYEDDRRPEAPRSAPRRKPAPLASCVVRRRVVGLESDFCKLRGGALAPQFPGSSKRSVAVGVERLSRSPEVVVGLESDFCTGKRLAACGQARNCIAVIHLDIYILYIRCVSFHDIPYNNHSCRAITPCSAYHHQHLMLT
jgi:hypothetical protein